MNPDMAPVTVYVNGRILTMVPGAPVAAALAVQEGRLAAVGDAEGVLALRGRDTEIVDLGGRTVLPGFVDPHNHFAAGALEAFAADCHTPPVRTIPEIQAALRAAAASTPPGEWVRGVGYHHAHLAERRHPTRGELDEAVPDRPALLLHISYHQGVAGIPQAFASDYPCGSVAPLVGIQAAVTRRSRDGELLDPEEGIPAQAALAAYTIEAARACGLEAECGSLEVGKRADLVLLDANPLEAPGEALARIRVTGTLVAGRPVWP
jgi:predicted amidohydrolase YtcJ